MKVFNLIRKEKKSYVEVAKIHCREQIFYPLNCEKGKNICASFAVMPQTAKVMARMCKCLIMMEKALNLYQYNKIF